MIGTLCFTTFARADPRLLLVKIQGVRKTIKENIRAELAIESYKNKLLEDVQVSQLIFHAKEDIQAALEPFGYYTADIEIKRKKTNKYHRLTIKIKLNEPIKVQAIHWQIEGEGEHHPALIKLFETFPLHPGDTLKHEPYENAKRDLLATAYFSGFIKAEFSTHDIYINLETKQANIYLTLNTDRLYTFGEVDFSDTYFKDRYLNRFIPFKVGNPFQPDGLLALQRNLILSDQFSQIKIDQSPNELDATIPIHVELERAKPNKYTFGAGYGTDTGIRGVAGWERRWINRLGHRFSLQGNLSQVYNQGYAEYKIPGLDPIQDYTAFSASASEDEYSEKESEFWQLGISNKRNFNAWDRILSLYYRQERFKEFDNLLKNNEKLLLPTLELSRIEKDDPINPLDGYLIGMKLTGSIDTLFSDASFTQLTARLNWLKTLNRKHILLFRTQLGITAPKDVQKLPLSMRFYAGGDNSLRGFGYRTLPMSINKAGQNISVGGAYLGISSLEWEYRLKSPLGIATFVDAGNAFRGFDDTVEAGAGFGIRWHTPIGPLKVDLAKPLTKAADAWRLHVTFGTGL
ncbi:MAG: autotransporter assembly complex family protein [Gammaproteobacteria bacterium]